MERPQLGEEEEGSQGRVRFFFFFFCYGVSNWDRKQKRLTVSEKMIILVLDLLNLRCWQSVHVLQLET